MAQWLGSAQAKKMESDEENTAGVTVITIFVSKGKERPEHAAREGASGDGPGRALRAAAGFKVRINCHTFRATGITAYLEAGGTLENAQAMAAHESPRTTKLYDRTGDTITLDEVERITI